MIALRLPSVTGTDPTERRCVTSLGRHALGPDALGPITSQATTATRRRRRRHPDLDRGAVGATHQHEDERLGRAVQTPRPTGAWTRSQRRPRCRPTDEIIQSPARRVHRSCSDDSGGRTPSRDSTRGRPSSRYSWTPSAASAGSSDDAAGGGDLGVPTMHRRLLRLTASPHPHLLLRREHVPRVVLRVGSPRGRRRAWCHRRAATPRARPCRQHRTVTATSPASGARPLRTANAGPTVDVGHVLDELADVPPRARGDRRIDGPASNAAAIRSVSAADRRRRDRPTCRSVTACSRESPRGRR